ncbi:kinase-like domain-containing protein, partial [Earliella scabrosa]
VVRVTCIAEEGRNHLALLRKLSRGTKSLLIENHIVPLWGEVHFEDISFTIRPLVGHSMDDCYGYWANNSVGDVVDMIIQALEAVSFIHDLGIVHRDLHKDNFLVQWHPESLTTMQVPICRPRVFLTDFEYAFEFPSDTSPAERLLTGLPVPDYRPRVAPEVTAGRPYDPFKADVWQLAYYFSNFDSTITEIREVMQQMTEIDSTLRLTAADARNKLAGIVNAIPPRDLLIAPIISEELE